MLADGEEPEDGGEYVLKTSDFKRRIDRERKKLLKEHFGTDDEEKVKQTVAKNKELQSKAEEQRRNELSEQARLKEDLDKRSGELTAAQARVRELEDEREIEQEDMRIRGSISEFIKPKYVKHAMADFADYLSEKLTPEQQDAMGDEQIKEWFQKYAAENPELAAKPGEASPPQQQQVRTVPVVNGHRQQEKPAPLPTGNLQGKTPIPGRPNSMNAEEYRQYKAQRGFS